MRKYLMAALLCMVMLVAMVPSAFAATNYEECMAGIAQQKAVQAQASANANALRKQGYSDSSAKPRPRSRTTRTCPSTPGTTSAS